MSSSGLKKIVNIAICGFGRAGRIHFHNIRKNHRCLLKYVLDCETKPVHHTLSEYNLSNVKVVCDQEYDSVLQDPDLDAVLVTTPTITHEGYIKRAIRANKSIFCEKPIASSVAGIAQCYSEAGKAGKPLFCAFNRRFDPSLLGLRQQVKEGKIGKIHEIRTVSRDGELAPMSYFKHAPVIYLDSAVHDFDWICWLAGEEPIGVFAHGVAHHQVIAERKDSDTAVIVLSFPSGIIGTVSVGRYSTYGYDQRAEVHGDKGMLVYENAREAVQFASSQGYLSGTPHPSFPERYAEAYARELDHFVDVVLDPSVPMLVTGESTLLASRVAAACEQSVKEGRMVPLEATPESSVY